MVVVWNTERVLRGGEVQLLAKAHTDVDIQRIRIAHFDDTRYLSVHLYSRIFSKTYRNILCS